MPYPTMPYIRLRDGAELYVRVLGQGEPVLILSGLGISSRFWLPFILPRLGSHQFFIPDFRGVGRSSSVALKPQDIFQSGMEDAQDLVAHFKLRRLALIGYSLGASTALHWQHNADFSAVERYLHIDQSPCIVNQPDWPYGLWGDEQDRYFFLLRQLSELLHRHPEHPHIADLPLDLRRRALDLLGRVLARAAASPWLHRFFLAAARTPGLLRRHALLRCQNLRITIESYLHAPDYRASLSRFPVPVSVFIGARSPLYAAAGQEAIADLAPRGHKVIFTHSDHMPPVREPIRFSRELQHFLHASSSTGLCWKP